MPLTVLVVDDEPLAREGLRFLLSEDPEIGTVHDAPDGARALEAIRLFRPDIVLLDVQMPGMDGFGVVRGLIGEPQPIIVFVTAHDRYAVRAFEVNALDYVLKPVTRARFRQTLARAKAHRRVSGADLGRQMRSLIDGVDAPAPYVDRLAVRSAGRVSFVNVDEIDFIQAAENYAELHCGSTTHLLHTTMATLEEALDPRLFIRVQRSIIVNRSCVETLHPTPHGEYRLTLRSGVELKSGRTYADRVRALKTNPF